MTRWIPIDDGDGGRWACVIGRVAIRVRSKTEAKRLALSGNQPGSTFRHATVRRWRKDRVQ